MTIHLNPLLPPPAHTDEIQAAVVPKAVVVINHGMNFRKTFPSNGFACPVLRK